MYAYAVLLPEMAKDLRLTLSEVFGILSLGLFFGGLVSPIAGKLVDQCSGPGTYSGNGSHRRCCHRPIQNGGPIFFEMLVSRSLYPLVTYSLSLGLMFSGFVVLLIFGFTLTGLLLAAADRIGARQMVLHFPYTAWYPNNIFSFPGYSENKLARIQVVLDPVVRTAEEMRIKLVIENIQDVRPETRCAMVDIPCASRRSAQSLAGC